MSNWLSGCRRAARFPPLLLTLIITLNASLNFGGYNQPLSAPWLCYSDPAKENQPPPCLRLGTRAARCWGWDGDPPSSAPGELPHGAASTLPQGDVSEPAPRPPRRITWGLFYCWLCVGPFHGFLVLFVPGSSPGRTAHADLSERRRQARGMLLPRQPLPCAAMQVARAAPSSQPPADTLQPQPQLQGDARPQVCHSLPGEHDLGLLLLTPGLV